MRGAAATLFALLVVGICVRLGFWQLDRLDQRRERNAALESAASLPVLELRDSFASIAADPARYLNRKARVSGSYLPTGEVVLRGRTDAGNPGVHIVSPLTLGGDTTVLVNRGWVPAPDGASVRPGDFPEPGERRVEGVLAAAPATDDASPLVIDVGGTRVQSFSRLPLDSLRAAADRPLLPLYLQQVTPPPAGDLPRRVPLPAMGEGPHLGYALQWFGFAAIAMVGLAVLLAKAAREGRSGPD